MSYMCHFQLSLCMFPSAALIPPCAATVCDLVGNSLEIHAVLNPASASPNAARSPAPPAPTTRQSYSWSITLYLPAPSPAGAACLLTQLVDSCLSLNPVLNIFLWVEVFGFLLISCSPDLWIGSLPVPPHSEAWLLYMFHFHTAPEPESPIPSPRARWKGRVGD